MSGMRQRPEHLEPRRYRVLHRTTYTYSAPVTTCLERGLLLPRESPSQRVVRSEYRVDPPALADVVHEDYFGNRTTYLEVPTHHSRLEITKDFEVDVAWPAIDLDALNRWTVGEAAALVRADPRFALDQALYLLPSPKVVVTDEVAAYARQKLPDDLGLGDALERLTVGIHDDFTYKSGVTTTRTTLAELLVLGRGVCQDFAQLAIGCLRHVGLPARYVSGYIETSPPPGRPKLAGSDASHAWVSVLTPDGAWADVDPTNAHFADSRYVVNAWGRDYNDVSPLKGVIFTDSKESRLDVGVDVIRLDDDRLPPDEA